MLIQGRQGCRESHQEPISVAELVFDESEVNFDVCESEKMPEYVTLDNLLKKNDSDIFDSRTMEFIPGSIHLRQYRDYWKSLGVSVDTIEMLTHGYRIPFTSLPGAYSEPNNATVRSNLGEAQKIVLDMHKKGIVKFVTEVPHCVNPLGLVIREVDGVIKTRLIFDASRWLNNFIEVKHVKLASLERVTQLIDKNDLLSTFDLQSCYYQIRIHPDHHKYLGASIELNGNPQYFVYKHLPFGISCAVHVVTKIWKPILAHVHKMGIRFEIYIDDGIIIASNSEQMSVAQTMVYEVVRNAGWQLSEDKSDTIGQSSQVKKYLGFNLDSRSLKTFATDVKLYELRMLIQSALSLKSLTIKDFSSITGKINSLIPSHDMLARVCNRSAYKLIDDHVGTSGWKGYVTVSDSVCREWKLFEENMFSLNGSLFRSPLNEFKVESFLLNPITDRPTIWSQITPSCLAFSDSSSWKAAVTYLTKNQCTDDFVFPFKEHEKATQVG